MNDAYVRCNDSDILCSRAQEGDEELAKAQNRIAILEDHVLGDGERIAELEVKLAAADKHELEQLHDIAELCKERELLRGTIRAQDERNRLATERVGMAPMDCDTPDWLAEEILGLRIELAAREQTILERDHDAREAQDERSRLNKHINKQDKQIEVLEADLAAARAELDTLRLHEHEWSEAHAMLTGKFEFGFAMTHPEGAHTELGKAAEALNVKVDALEAELQAAQFELKNAQIREANQAAFHEHELSEAVRFQDVALQAAQAKAAALEADLAALRVGEEYNRKIMAAKDEKIIALRADLAAARAERDTLWAYVRSGFAITEHEENCEVCGLNVVPCETMKRLETENMRGFNAIMGLMAKQQ